MGGCEPQAFSRIRGSAGSVPFVLLPASPFTRRLAWGVPALLLGALSILQTGGHDVALMLDLNHALLGLDGSAASAKLPAPTPIVDWPAATGLTLVLAAFWSALSVLGLGLSALLLFLVAPRRQPLRIAAFLICLLVGGLATHAVKRVVNEPRPAVVLQGQGLQVVGQTLRHHAMPSGHATTAFACAGLVLLGPWVTRRRLALASLGAVTLAAAGGVALSRVAVGAHWPSDLLAGGAIGWLSAGLSLWLAERSGLARWCGTRPAWWLLAALRTGGGLALCLADTGYPLGQPLQWALGGGSVAGGLLDAWRLWREGRHASQLAPAATDARIQSAAAQPLPDASRDPGGNGLQRPGP